MAAIKEHSEKVMKLRLEEIHRLAQEGARKQVQALQAQIDELRRQTPRRPRRRDRMRDAMCGVGVAAAKKFTKLL